MPSNIQLPEAPLRRYRNGEEEDEAALRCTLAAVIQPTPTPVRHSLPEASGFQSGSCCDVKRKSDSTTLLLEPVSPFDIPAGWPRESRSADISTRPENGRLIQKARKQLPATQQHNYKPSSKLTEQMKYCNSILKELADEHSRSFRHPTDAELLGLRDYPEIIKHPMDMGVVNQKMDIRVYDSHEEFARDMRLVFKKCYRYNPSGHEVVAMAQELQTLFKLLYAKMPHESHSKKRQPSPQSENADSNSSWTSQSFLRRQPVPLGNPACPYHISNPDKEDDDDYWRYERK
ncbi:hypothetical protein HPB48_015304 [Haemaphysalis longicornis]|uniref:Bromo domain-containing protein n=1 Tax=Haemaphysalis longicornis TaxID=44386 RepID=A0A9J6G911_HAELO|nr:hypothetical protein HPB48_015304 [Haemaphysalis longicornis]